MFDYKKNKVLFENISIIMQIGLTMSGSLLFCLFVGKFLDNWLNTRSIFTLIFIFFGIFGGINVCYRQIDIVFSNKSKKNKNN